MSYRSTHFVELKIQTVIINANAMFMLFFYFRIRVFNKREKYEKGDSA